MMTTELLGFRIRKEREKKGLTQLDVAMMIGIEQSTYAKIENGKITISVERLISIAKVFDVSINELIENEKKENRNTRNEFDEKFNLIIESQKKILDNQMSFLSLLKRFFLRRS